MAIRADELVRSKVRPMPLNRVFTSLIEPENSVASFRTDKQSIEWSSYPKQNPFECLFRYSCGYILYSAGDGIEKNVRESRCIVIENPVDEIEIVRT